MSSANIEASFKLKDDKLPDQARQYVIRHEKLCVRCEQGQSNASVDKRKNLPAALNWRGWHPGPGMCTKPHHTTPHHTRVEPGLSDEKIAVEEPVVSAAAVEPAPDQSEYWNRPPARRRRN